MKLGEGFGGVSLKLGNLQSDLQWAALRTVRTLSENGCGNVRDEGMNPGMRELIHQGYVFEISDQVRS
jgi:hypothetical protein